MVETTDFLPGGGMVNIGNADEPWKEIHAEKIYSDGHAVVRSINNQYADDNGNVNLSAFQVGDIKWSASEKASDGFLLCDGASVSRAMYPELFEAIGTAYGSVDDEHFNLPNLMGRFIEGSATVGQYKEAGLPNITGHSNVRDLSNGTDILTGNGAFSISEANLSQAINITTVDKNYSSRLSFDASRSSSIYGKSSTVQPASLTARPYIKAFDAVANDSGLIDVTEYANELAGKADRSLSNLSEKGKKAFFPGNTFVNIAITATEQTYTTPANGFMFFSGISNGTGYAGLSTTIATRSVATSSEGMSIFLPVKKGHLVTIRNSNISNITCKFIYAEGEVPV